ncbi:lytic transglycosylase domain-containing protein, partial [bacterium]
IRAMLLKLHQGDYTPAQLDAEERRLYDLFQSDPDPLKFLAATEEGRIRSQTGIQDKFTAGLEASGQYLEEIEDIFSSHGVPVEITRLVFVESMFNMKARSKVGASGIWQFMPSTGRLYLGIDSVADERNDPIMASHAAAKLLRANYEALGNWPLAINAYNSGRGTLQRAMSVLGTDDIATIILNYSGGVYGFASRNFYPCFLAALELSNQYPKHFGKLKIKPALKYEYYYPKSPQFFGQLTTAAGANWDEIVHLNPHFSEAVLSDARKIPAGYHLRVPKGSQARFARAEAAILNGDLSPTAIAQTEAERARSEFAPGSSSDSGPAESDLISPANALER